MAKNGLPERHRDVANVVNCTGANLRKAARAVTQTYDAALQPSGLKLTQFSLLATLDQIGDAPLTRLADALVMDRTTLTRNLKPMIRDGLVQIEQDDDQRVRVISLTEMGKNKFEDALPRWEALQVRLLASLGGDRWAGLIDDLVATVDAAREA
jgi:DNA-binding MarR family transcriptional regulator